MRIYYAQGAEEQVKLLKDELQCMQRFVRDASEKQDRKEKIGEWLSGVADVTHNADDIIDALFLKVEAVEQVELLRSKLRDVGITRERYGIQDLGYEGIMHSWRPRQLSPRQKDKQLVGIEDDVEILLGKVILDNSKGLSTTSIVGPVGIGKSTLARRMYDHAAAAGGFDRCVWVVVSGEYTPKDVVKELTLQLLDPTEDKVREEKSLEELPLLSIQEKLRRSLQDARFFVVIDDVGQDAQWESIASIFAIDEDKGSRLLLTSRNEDIAKHVIGYVHKMKTLDLNKSWELFTKKAFIDNNNNNIDGKLSEDLEITGREILKKCDCLPLAIVLVGGVLWEKNPSKRKWEKVLNDVNNTHLGSSTILSTILELSYRDLSPQLKSCFLCIGFFNEHVPIIRAEKLVQVWIAQGLVVPLEGRDQEETKEEIGMCYLDELINRNMVDIKDLSKDGRIKSCCIHHLIRELSATKAKKEISFEIIRKDGKSQPLDKPRHLAIYRGGDQRFVYSSNCQHEHINAHSLFFHGIGNSVNNNNPSYLKTFELLKILDFEDLPLKNLPEAIGLLTWLKYLGLRNTSIKSLPHSIGKLKNLEVLDIAKVYKVVVGDVIREMESLRHIHAGYFYSVDRLKTDTLKNLQTLGYIYAGNLIPEQVKKMRALRKLSLFITRDLGFKGIELFPSLAMLENLVCLELKWGPPDSIRHSELKMLDSLHRVTRLKLKGIVSEFPSASEFPPNLSHLTVLLRSTSAYNTDPTWELEKLPKLVYLKLDCDQYPGLTYMRISENGFPMLEVLVLRKMSKVGSVRLGKGAMPMIKRLYLYRCGEHLLTNLPEKLRSVTTILSL
ncbi:hypothetical protein ACP275_06G202900 [Erythranthe tilingii]